MAVNPTDAGKRYAHYVQTIRKLGEDHDRDVDELKGRQERRLDYIADKNKENLSEVRKEFDERAGTLQNKARESTQELQERQNARVNEIKNDLYDQNARLSKEKTSELSNLRNYYNKEFETQDKMGEKEVESRNREHEKIQNQTRENFKGQIGDLEESFDEFRKRAGDRFQKTLMQERTQSNENVNQARREGVEGLDKTNHQWTNKLDDLRRTYGNQVSALEKEKEDVIKQNSADKAHLIRRTAQDNIINETLRSNRDNRDRIGDIMRKNADERNELLRAHHTESREDKHNYRRTVDRLEDDYSDNLENLKFRNNLSSARSEAERLAAHRNHERRTEEIVKGIREAKDEDLSSERKRFQAALDEKSDQYQKALRKLASDQGWRHSTSEVYLNDELKRAKEQITENVTKERRTNEIRRKDLIKQFGNQIDDLEQKKEQGISSLNAQHGHELTELGEKYKKQISKTSGELIKQHDEEKMHLNEKLSQVKFFERMRADGQVMTAEESMKRQKMHYLQDLMDRAERFDDILEARGTEHREEIRNLIVENKEKERNIREDFKQSTLKMKQQYDKEIAQMRMEHLTEVNRMKRDFTKEMDVEKRLAKRNIENTVREYEMRLKSQKEAYEHRINTANKREEDLREQLSNRLSHA